MADETLHVKFQREGIVVELEGSAAAVQAELTALKADGYGRLPEFFVGSVAPPAPGPVTSPGSLPPSPDTPVVTPSAPQAPLVPIVAPARSLRFVVNSWQVPVARNECAADLNGDGRVDNQFGNLIGALQAQNMDVQASVNQSTAVFASPLLIRIETEQAVLTVDQRIDVTILSGTVLDAGQRIFQVDPSRPPVTLLCRLQSTKAVSQAPLLGGAVRTLPITIDLFGQMPPRLPIGAAQMSFTLVGDGSSLLAGQINGAISAADLKNVFAPAVATALSAKVAADPLSSTSQQILQIFDLGGCTNPDGSQAQAHDGIIDICEVLTNPIIRSVLNPDVQLFDLNGNFAPGLSGAQKDSFSVGLGFTAVSATF